MKEGVGVLKGKLFVCHFCLLGAEKRAGLCKKGMREARKENEILKTHQIEQEMLERVEVVQKEEVTEDMTESEVVTCDSVGKTVVVSDGEKEAVCQ